MVKISDAVMCSSDILKDTVPSPRSEAEMLASYVFGKSRLELVIHKDDAVSKEEFDKLKELSLDRCSGKPMAYITGIKEFMSIDFDVNENVLIPRPETEELVQLIIDLYKNKTVKLLDLCTGSGAICCSVAYYLEKAKCHGVDISTHAIETARRNAEKLGVSPRVSFVVADVLNPVQIDEKFDVVVSNPPYIESHIIDTLHPTVKDFEPHLALDGGEDGLAFYKKIIENIDLYLNIGGLLLFEIGYNQGDALKCMLQPRFTDIKIIKDLSGNDRIAYARLI